MLLSFFSASGKTLSDGLRLLPSSHWTATAFIFTRMPCSAAWRIASNTCSSRSWPVISWYRFRSKVSRLTLIPSIPAFLSGSRKGFSRTPFVVIVTVSMPGTAFNISTRRQQSFLTKGSPPVIFRWRIPRPAPQTATWQISSRLRISLGLTQSIPSGIQYLHRRLQRSVMEIRI